jgi:hypothetical protein
MRHWKRCVPRERFAIVRVSPAFMNRGSTPRTGSAAGVPRGRAAFRRSTMPPPKAFTSVKEWTSPPTLSTTSA